MTRTNTRLSGPATLNSSRVSQPGSSNETLSISEQLFGQALSQLLGPTVFDRCDIILHSNSTEQDIGIVATELVIILHVCAMAADSSTFMFCHKVWEGCRRGKNVEVRFPSQLIQRDRGKHLQPSPVLTSKYRHGNSWQGELVLGFEGRLVFLTSWSEENARFHVCPKTPPVA